MNAIDLSLNNVLADLAARIRDVTKPTEEREPS
jgi:hypothetical protein